MRLQVSEDLTGPQRRIWFIPEAHMGTIASGSYVVAAMEGDP